MKTWLLLLLLVIMFAFPQAALADVAPPYQPPGANPGPGSESTQVRMLAENVLIDVLPGSGESLGKAQVTADFTMRNLGSEAESMAARFPISASDGRFNFPEIKNLLVKVNGNNVRTRRIEGEDPFYGSELVPWAEFDVTFPPDEDVEIRVTYTLVGTGYAPFVSFQYILSSGAGWRDTIGSADLTVRLPYIANPHNVIFDEQIGWSMTTPGGKLQGREIRWHYDDLEPSYEHNLDVALVTPSNWLRILNERDNVTNIPQDGEAWGRLGKAYKEIAYLSKERRADPAGGELYELSIAAYEECLRLKPNDADWHAGLADLYYLNFNLTRWGDPYNHDDLVLASELLQRAIELNPNSRKAQELLQEFEWQSYVTNQGGKYDFLVLTATPTAWVFSTRTAEPLPTETPSPTVEATAIRLVETPVILDAAPASQTPAAEIAAAAPTVTSEPPTPVQAAAASPTAAPESSPRGGLCGAGIAVLPFGLAALVISRRRIKRTGSPHRVARSG